MAEASPRQKLEELKNKYVAGLPDRMRELRDSWSRLLHVSWDPKVLVFMHNCAHKLHGSGATFQFPEISETAGVLEEQLHLLLAKADASSAERQQIDHSLKALERAITGASRADIKRDTPASAPKTSTENHPHYRIAVIEDDAIQAAYLKSWLEQQGYSADTFEDPDTYTQRTHNHAHHLILLDIGFPQGPLEGIGWLERMRRQAGSNIPVIMMSARSDMVARMRALRAGADIYLTKPIDMGVLEERIHQLLKDTPLGTAKSSLGRRRCRTSRLLQNHADRGRLRGRYPQQAGACLGAHRTISARCHRVRPQHARLPRYGARARAQAGCSLHDHPDSVRICLA